MSEESGPIAADQKKEFIELIRKARKHFKAAYDADRESRQDGMEDMKFACVPGSQWDQNQKKERGNRPCYEFNKIRVTGKRIINAMRDSRPGGKVIGEEDNDKETAEILEGLIRNIWSRGGDSVMDYAAEYQVFAGYGAWRVDVDYAHADTFDQDIKVEPLINPFCLFADSAARDILKRDARHWVLTEKIPNDEFEAKYNDRHKVHFDSHEFDDDDEWEDEEEIRIAEYWYKKPVTKTIYQLTDGSVVDDVEGLEKSAIVKTRDCETHEIWMCVVSGNAILEKPVKWAGTIFPFIPVYGEYYIIDGKIRWYGITRPSKDPQRSYNTSRTAVTETIAMAPQAKFWATPKQAEGHEAHWKTAHYKNYPFMLFNADPENPGAPQRMGSADVPIALIQEVQLAAEEINMVTGIYQSDVGAPSQSTSGRHEIAKQQAGSLATFNYQDNMSNAVEQTYRVLIDLIPKVYDTERNLRILGQDETEKYFRVNLADMAVGKYDVQVKSGPNFTTKRQEAAETYQGLLQGNPDIFPIVGDLIFKSMDLPYAEEIAERLRVMAPEPIQRMLNEEQEMPPEVMAMMQQAQQGMAMVEQGMQQAQQAAQEAELSKSEVEKAMAELEKDQAQFEAQVAKELAKLAKAEAGLVKKSLQDSTEAVVETTRRQASEEAQVFNAAVGAEIAQGIQAIQQMAADFNAQAAQVVADIKQQKDDTPRIKEVIATRENGTLKAVPVYEDL